MPLNFDDSLRYANSDRERLKMCDLAKIVHDAIYDQASDLAERGPAILNLNLNLNIVDLKLEEFGDFEIVIRKKL